MKMIDIYFYEGLRHLLGGLIWLISGAQTRPIPDRKENNLLWEIRINIQKHRQCLGVQQKDDFEYNMGQFT